MINVSNLSYSYGANKIFDGINFSISSGIKVGLVGPNGAGKSTLLSLITKTAVPDLGKIDILGSVGYVPQEIKYDATLEKSKTIRDYIDPSHMHLDYKLEKMLTGLELGKLNLEDKPQPLSGGQKTKLALARALIAEPDILLLDEPTNFMDIQGKKWVMNFLSQYQKTLVLISHDIELIDKYIDKIVVLDPIKKKVEEYKSNYSKYLLLKAEKDRLLERYIGNATNSIKRMQKGLEKIAGSKTEKGVRARVNLERRIERAKDNLPEMPKEAKKIKFKLQEPARVGELPLKASNISKSFSDALILDNISLSIYRSERVALIGRNGAGKSTFIKILMGLITPDNGEIIRDEKLKIGYYSQEFEVFDFDKTLLQTVRDVTSLADSNIRPILGKFLFSGQKIFQTVGSLSGGEKTRLAIALLVLQDYNLLILDEPTTYLDILSQRIILEVLKEYQGAMLVVSHTEEFIKELNPSRVLLLPDNEIKYWSDDLLDVIGEV